MWHTTCCPVQLVYIPNGCQVYCFEWQTNGRSLCGPAPWFWNFSFKKALYGLKKAPKVWYDKINSFFISFGFERDRNFHVLPQDGLMCLVILYIDNLLTTSSFEAKIEHLHNELKTRHNGRFMTSTWACRSIIHMEAYFSVRISTFNNFLKLIAWMIASLYHLGLRGGVRDCWQ